MADDKKNPNAPQEGALNIELSEDVAEGIYSNLAIITHSNSEFIIDFIKVLPGVPKARVKSIIFLTPQHAKLLVNALQYNISKYEQHHGKIADTGSGPGPNMPMNFGGPTAQA